MSNYLPGIDVVMVVRRTTVIAERTGFLIHFQVYGPSDHAWALCPSDTFILEIKPYGVSYITEFKPCVTGASFKDYNPTGYCTLEWILNATSHKACQANIIIVHFKS